METTMLAPEYVFTIRSGRRSYAFSYSYCAHINFLVPRRADLHTSFRYAPARRGTDRILEPRTSPTEVKQTGS